MTFATVLSGSVSVGSFHYRNQTLTKVGCAFVLLRLSPCGPCGCGVCVYVCEAPGDDILIFVNFRLEATVSQSPVVKGKNKRHVRICACTHTHTQYLTATHYSKATQNSEHNKQHSFLVKVVLLAGELPNFFPLLLFGVLFSLSLHSSGGNKEVRCLHRLKGSQIN